MLRLQQDCPRSVCSKQQCNIAHFSPSCESTVIEPESPCLIIFLAVFFMCIFRRPGPTIGPVPWDQTVRGSWLFSRSKLKKRFDGGWGGLRFRDAVASPADQTLGNSPRGARPGVRVKPHPGFFVFGPRSSTVPKGARGFFRRVAARSGCNAPAAEWSGYDSTQPLSGEAGKDA